MLIDELVDNLRRQVDPDVEDSVLTLPLEGFKQIFLNIRHDGMGPSKVEMVPLTIRLVASDTLLANRSISQQMIDELDGEYFDLMIFFKSTHIDVVTLSYIQKDTVDKEQERFNIQELTPTQTEIEEKLCETLIVNTFSVKLV